MTDKTTDHWIRRLAIQELAHSGEVDLDLLFGSLSDDDLADFEIIQGYYDWPRSWAPERRAIAMFCSSSEYQLKRYLEFVRDGGAPPGIMDKIMNAVFGLRLVEDRQHD